MTDEQNRTGQAGLNPVISIDGANESTTQADYLITEAVSKHAEEPKSYLVESQKSERQFIAYTVKLPAEQLAALQSIWLELKRLYGTNSPDKSGMIQQAVEDWLKRWDGPERRNLLDNLLEIRQDTRRRQYKKSL